MCSLRQRTKFSTDTGLTGSSNTWIWYYASDFYLAIRIPLLSADLRSAAQLLSTSLTGTLHILPFTCGDLNFGFIVNLLNKIVLETSLFSSLQILTNSFGNSKISSLLITAWHAICCTFNVLSHILQIYKLPSYGLTENIT